MRKPTSLDDAGPAGPTPRASGGVTRAYWFLVADIFLGFTAGGATMPFLSLYVTSLGASLRQVPLVIGVQSAVAVGAGLAWGRVIDRVGRRRPFITGAQAASALLSMAVGGAPSWQWLIPLQALRGAAGAAQQTASLSLMGDLLEGHPQRGRLVSAYRMCGSLAFSVAILMSGWLSQTAGLRGCFRLAALVYAAAYVVSYGIREPSPRATANSAATGFAGLLSGPMRHLLIVAFTFGLPFAAVYSVWPIWVAQVRGLGRAVFSQLWGVAAFVEVPCTGV